MSAWDRIFWFSITAYLLFGVAFAGPILSAREDLVDVPGCLMPFLALLLVLAWPFFLAAILTAALIRVAMGE